MLPFPVPDEAPGEPFDRVTSEYIDCFIADTKRPLAAQCANFGHVRVACWRAGELRAWRCTRCGTEEPQS